MFYGGKSLFWRQRDLNHKHQKVFWRIALLAGFLKGLLGNAVGALLLPCVLRHELIHSTSSAVGTTIMLVFVASVCALVSRLIDPSVLDPFTNPHQQFQLFQMFLWIIPGSIVGSKVGPTLTHRIDKPHIRKYVGVLLVFVGLVSILRATALGVLSKFGILSLFAFAGVTSKQMQQTQHNQVLMS